MFNLLKNVWRKLMGREWYQSYFTPKNPTKCINMRQGKPPYARSSWETRVFNWCDLNDNVLEWGSEVIKVPYIFDADKKLHNYIPDIWCRLKNNNNEINTYILEIKPIKQTTPPKEPKNKTKKALRNYNYAKLEFLKNKNKWFYARQFCEGRDWKFRIISENTIF